MKKIPNKPVNNVKCLSIFSITNLNHPNKGKYQLLFWRNNHIATRWIRLYRCRRRFAPTNVCFNFRYKNPMPDRYRDVSSKCDRYLPPPHYLASGAPLVSTGGSLNSNVVDTNSINMYGSVMNRGLVGNPNNSIVTNSTDNYLSGYLSSSVHTPVKRYIPSTNTIATDIYSDSTVVLPHHQQVRIWRQSSRRTC